MRWAVLGLMLGLGIASGCAPTNLSSRPVGPGEVPIAFAYGALRGGGAAYTAADEPRTGYKVRRALFVGGGESAMFDLVQTVGDFGFPRRSVRAHVERLLKPGLKVEWGGTGRTAAAARTTEYQAFLLPDERRACVGMVRSLAEHIESAGDFSQRIVMGFYCRPGETQVGPDEAREVADALQA